MVISYIIYASVINIPSFHLSLLQQHVHIDRPLHTFVSSPFSRDQHKCKIKVLITDRYKIAINFATDITRLNPSLLI